ncbi:hypothetical protein O6H91_02G094900 [Diphasiastrum complanatum]|uniref:Uncharacterized protein n=1 Tax=Diphasiastrum complanatum TaxID=34168 RepID=A0ACC2EIN9_DIPCM|nr:hypothetical protein O6H91_02G094900 [Diphasiastrum complanatum]
MGNRISRKRAAVEERYTRPHGLYQHRDVDYKKLRRLILDAKLAPCYPGADDSQEDLEECLICFLYYPSLNSSKCCFKGICTECFLQMKSPHATRPTQCPFCKTANYAVEYRGTRTIEEKDLEQILNFMKLSLPSFLPGRFYGCLRHFSFQEEQKVIEAKIKIQQQELQAEMQRVEYSEEERCPRALVERPSGVVPLTLSCGLPLVNLPESVTSTCSSDGTLTVRGYQQTQQEVIGSTDDSEQGSPIGHGHGAYCPSLVLVSNVLASLRNSSSYTGVDGSSSSSAVLSAHEAEIAVPAYPRSRRDEDFLLDLEDIMVMEAIWQSIQEQGPNKLFKSDSYMIGPISTSLLDLCKAFRNEESGYNRSKLTGIRDLSNRSNFVTGGLAVAIAKLAERRALSGANPLECQAQQMVASHLLDHHYNDHQEFQQALDVTDTCWQEEPQAVNMRQVQCQSPSYIEDEDLTQRNLISRSTLQVHNSENCSAARANSGNLMGKAVQYQDPNHDHLSSMSQEVLVSNCNVADVDSRFSHMLVSTSDMKFTISESSLNNPPLDVGMDLAQVGALNIVPETFEEQMILAMTLSLAEAHTRNFV